MRKSIVTIFTVFICQVVIGQTPNATKLSDSLLKAGSFKVVVTTYDFPNDVKVLQEKALKSLKSNPQWADKYIVVQVQKGAPDIPKLLDVYGLTESEFDTMITGFKKKKQTIFSDTTPFIINKANGLITFKTTKSLNLFNNLRIDTRKQAVLFDNLKTTRELFISGKFYAPILNGFETHSSEQTTHDNKTGITNFGFAIGVNSGDIRPSITLIYSKGQINDTKFLSITLL